MSLDLYLVADLGAGDVTVTQRDLNITHNLGPMWRELWGCTLGDLLEGKTAGQTLPALRAGLDRLRTDPVTFQALNPLNGWGSYDGAVAFLRDVIDCAESAPAARWKVSR